MARISAIIIYLLASISTAAYTPRVIGKRQSEPIGTGNAWGVYLKFPYKTYIDSWTLTITVPAVPKPQVDEGYSGIGFSTTSYQYSIRLASYSNPQKIGCNAKPGQWCITPSYLGFNGKVNGTVKAVSPGDILVYSFKQETPTGGTIGLGYRVKVTRNGQVLTQIRASDNGLGNGYLAGSQCEQNNQLLPAFDYRNLTYVLGLKYPDFVRDSPPIAVESTNSKPYTTDGGLTWKIDTLHLPSTQCTLP